MLALSPLRVRSLSTSLFLKVLLALSGAGWFFFLINHLYSNLHLFAGREPFNAYYAGLKESPAVLWGIRGALIAGFLVHVGASIAIIRRRGFAPFAWYRILAGTLLVIGVAIGWFA